MPHVCLFLTALGLALASCVCAQSETALDTAALEKTVEVLYQNHQKWLEPPVLRADQVAPHDELPYLSEVPWQWLERGPRISFDDLAPQISDGFRSTFEPLDDRHCLLVGFTLTAPKRLKQSKILVRLLHHTLQDAKGQRLDIATTPSFFKQAVQYNGVNNAVENKVLMPIMDYDFGLTISNFEALTLPIEGTLQVEIGYPTGYETITYTPAEVGQSKPLTNHTVTLLAFHYNRIRYRVEGSDLAKVAPVSPKDVLLRIHKYKQPQTTVHQVTNEGYQAVDQAFQTQPNLTPTAFQSIITPFVTEELLGTDPSRPPDFHQTWFSFPVSKVLFYAPILERVQLQVELSTGMD